jgi:hypothetical protein
MGAYVYECAATGPPNSREPLRWVHAHGHEKGGVRIAAQRSRDMLAHDSSGVGHAEPLLSFVPDAQRFQIRREQ